MMRAIVWGLAVVLVLAAGIVVSFSPQPTVTKAFAQDGKAPEKP